MINQLHVAADDGITIVEVSALASVDGDEIGGVDLGITQVFTVEAVEMHSAAEMYYCTEQLYILKIFISLFLIIINLLQLN